MSVADSKVEKARRAAGSFRLVTAAGTRAAAPAPAADEEWELPGGRARLYYGAGPRGMVRPVVLADGFGLGPTDFDRLWHDLENGPFPFVSELRRCGRTLVLVGFADRGASVLRNAETMTAAVLRTTAEQLGGARLLVGGFGTGGMVARYAMAWMETRRLDHRAGVYLSFDSPHRGAWLPIGLQALAHHVAPYDDTLLRQISSPAARQLLWRHLDSAGGTPQESPLRTAFRQRLHDVGDWPRIPRVLAVSSGRGDGTGNGVRAGAKILSCAGPLFDGTRFLAQAQGQKAEVAAVGGVLGAPRTITTDGFPELDGAPGGTLESFGLLADALAAAGEHTEAAHRRVCFVPSVSAVAIRDLDQQSDLYADIGELPPEDSEADDFLLSSANGAHAAMTEEIGGWILDRLPD
ncbi:hypothetical protein AB0M11_22110 [Streptomyces sp. NPDC051987]|uniref:hypothetical protein n=1 Tax=Streptomyces sp. NPDC051987 TaxID=3155808 RepID=UPI00344A3CA6